LQGEDSYLRFSSPFYVFYEEKKMTYSEFLDVLKKYEIDYDYTGWRPSDYITIPQEDQKDIYKFEIHLLPDEDQDLEEMFSKTKYKKILDKVNNKE
jgi:hypothetical protein